MKHRLETFAPFAISFTVTCAFFINLCDRIFACGCRSLWAGADAMCNIHAAQGRHCPWCSHGVAGYAVVMAVLCAPQLAVARYSPWGWKARTAAAVVLFPVMGLLFGLLSGWWDAYW